MTHKLFEAKIGWDISSCPSPFDNAKKRCTDPAGKHQLSDTAQSTLHRDTIEALMEIKGVTGDINNIHYGDYAIVKIGSHKYAAERKLIDDTYEIAVYQVNTGVVEATQISTTNRYTPFDSIGDKNADVDTTVIQLAILGALIDMNEEANGRALSDIINGLDTTKVDNDWYLVCDTVYQNVTKPSGSTQVNIPQDNTLNMIKKQTVSSGAYSGTVLFGKPKILVGN